MIPIMQTGNVKVSFINSLFISASAFSDTGLVTVPTYATWSIFGQAILAILMLLGGLGVFTIKIFIFNYVLKLTSGVNERELVNTERGSSNVGNVGGVIVSSMLVIFIIVVFSGFAFTFYFHFVDARSVFADNLSATTNTYRFINPKNDWSLSFRYGFFHSISSINNAGFDIFGSNSLAPYYNNYDFQFFTIVLFVIGGIGYPVIYDVVIHLRAKYRTWYMRKIKGKTDYNFRKVKWSLFTKLSIITYVLVGIVMICLTFAFEVSSRDPESLWNNAKYGDKLAKSMAIIFNVTATRSAGYTTIDLGNLTTPTIILSSIAMLIGASPSSTGGGIRTTTLAVVILALIAKITHSPKVRIFKRSISPETVSMSYTVFSLSLILVTLVTFISASSLSSFGGAVNSMNTADAQRVYGLSHLFFEVTSAFGTTGLSTGITASLNIPSQLSIIIAMFVGQLGISSTILAWKSKRRKEYSYEYIEEGISIG
ncbi:TrkH family potassium uptake protein [Mycoplasma testudineum]|nr:TrkH family potassium uptake protein [Mycoplasma testudineum]